MNLVRLRHKLSLEQRFFRLEDRFEINKFLNQVNMIFLEVFEYF